MHTIEFFSPYSGPDIPVRSTANNQAQVVPEYEGRFEIRDI